jgi:hypothetical protein
LASGGTSVDAGALRGRKRAEEHLPHRLAGLRAIVAAQRQAAPQVRTSRLSTRLTAAEARRQPIARKGSPAEARPPAQPIGARPTALGYPRRAVAKPRPQASSPSPTPSSRG